MDVTGEVKGVALCVNSSVSDPVYVSVGHMVALNDAVHLVRRSSRYRVPEPIRVADLHSRQLVKNLHKS